MLNSTVLEVAIGLVFCYSSVTLIASALYEGLATFLKLRASTLWDGVKDLLNDPGFSSLAKEIYQHALVNPRDSGALESGKRPVKMPSYIQANNFALAFVDTIKKAPGAAGDLKAKIEALPQGQIREMLVGMWDRAEGKVEHLTAQLADWFDSGMDRVSGCYKRWSQLYTFLMAFAIAGLLNIDSIHLFRTLWVEHALTAQIANPAAIPSAGEALTALKVLPIGWSNSPTTVFAGILMVCGWLITASSALFGAPFWFDLLKRLTNLRGAGKNPSEKTKK
jgi:hypothetical protein